MSNLLPPDTDHSIELDRHELEDCRACHRHNAPHTQCKTDECGKGICWCCAIVCLKCQEPYCVKCASEFEAGVCVKCLEASCEDAR